MEVKLIIRINHAESASIRNGIPPKIVPPFTMISIPSDENDLIAIKLVTAPIRRTVKTVITGLIFKGKKGRAASPDKRINANSLKRNLINSMSSKSIIPGLNQLTV
jgi:hypothetical protein